MAEGGAEVVRLLFVLGRHVGRGRHRPRWSLGSFT